MHRLAIAIVLSGCSTGTLRVGGVMIGDRPAFQASMEFGTSFGGRQAVSITHEHGVQADQRAAYFNAINADFVASSANAEGEDEGPIVRIGARMRASNDSTVFEIRGAVFTIDREAKTHSGGLGVEIAGGVDMLMQPVYEAVLVLHGRQPLW